MKYLLVGLINESPDAGDVGTSEEGSDCGCRGLRQGGPPGVSARRAVGVEDRLELPDEVRLQGAGEVGVLDFEADRAGPTGGRLEVRIDRLVVAVDVP